jgi:CDP-diacylglycerol---glycerol-3-phosphate 3-phosphatidyltransferase
MGSAQEPLLNLPNAITAARIVAAPVIAVLMVYPSWQLRMGGWVLYIAAAVTDYYDGKLARSRNLVTDLGRLLDPLADKALLLCTLLPMYWLTRGVGLLAHVPNDANWFVDSVVGPVLTPGGGTAYPFVTPFGLIGLPFWIVAVVLGREIFMTIFRQLAARRGVIISAIGPAKWKTAFQLTWAGAAFFWFFTALSAARHHWTSPVWRQFAYFNGLVGTISMIAAVVLTIYSLWLYVSRYGVVLVRPAAERRAP